MYPLLKDLRAYCHTIMCFSFGNAHHLTLSMQFTQQNKDRLLKKEIQLLENYLLQKGYHNISILPIEPSIEDCFMLL